MLSSVAPVRAGETAEGKGKPDIWIVTLGGWGTFEPKSEGSTHMGPGFRPLVSVRESGARDWLVLPNDGLDYELIETDNFRAGPVVNVKWYSEKGAIPRGFRHWAGLELSGEAGVFAEYWPTRGLRTRIEAREAVFGAEGLVADVSADFVWRPDAWTFTAGPRVAFADSRYMRSYYGVTPQQSATSGLPVYSASAGLQSYGLGTMVAYQWSKRWTSTGFVEYERLAGSAGDSPLIDQRGARDQVSVGLGLTMTFGVGR